MSSSNRWKRTNHGVGSRRAEGGWRSSDLVEIDMESRQLVRRKVAWVAWVYYVDSTGNCHWIFYPRRLAGRNKRSELASQSPVAGRQGIAANCLNFECSRNLHRKIIAFQ